MLNKMISQKDRYKLPTAPSDVRQLGQLTGSACVLECAEIIERHLGLAILITPDRQTGLQLEYELQAFISHPISILPDWETLPYDHFSPHQSIISDRLACLYQLPSRDRGAIIIPINTFMQRICPYSFLQRHAVFLKKNQRLSLDLLRVQLDKAGYRSVHQVMEHGEFAIRGGLLDLYPMGSEEPYRIDFFDNEIESLRVFDVDTQRTLSEIEQINLLPAHEFPIDKTAIESFRSQWREQFEIRRDPEHIYQQVSKNILPAGIEYWQPLFFNEPLDTLFDYLSSDVLLMNIGDIQAAAEGFWKDIHQRYEHRRIDPMRPLLAPDKLWLNVPELFSGLKAWPRIQLRTETLPNKSANTNLPYEPLPELAVQRSQKNPLMHLSDFIKRFKGIVVFSVETEGRQETLRDLLKPMEINPILISSLDEAIQHGHYLMPGAMERGFIDTQRLRAFICESDLLGERVNRRRQDNRRIINTDVLIRNLMELRSGQPVVHLEHGVGRYLGLINLETGGIQAEYLILGYANEDKLYVPVSSLNVITRYSGSSDENAPLHKLGGDAWTKACKKTLEKVRDVAAELLGIYSQRAAKPGFSFKKDSEQYQLFCESFPFETTPDQEQAIHAVLNDMSQPLAMDRLVCGDVGFGKTEVAMRAAFLAVINHKQVAVLVPTTLLAQQHFDNFRDRFAHWPIQIEMLSRFRTAKEQKQILQQVAEGKLDILIGTHKLLKNDLCWKDLGLLIVDEEHRFGVRHKERIKAIRTDVDILTLTATPIPRTLNMAMSGMRDLSIIATPPARRLSVKTFVREYDSFLIKEAILREILRGGQVYYLYNEVETIEKTYETLKKLVPEARITLAHGQMRERDLERVMNDFHHQRFNLLVCTTIIETGIDIANANTIIIEKANHFGLAQLHQLRGRVGRSHHQAYAYLLTPPPKAITNDAKKRLEVITSLEDLGSGFALATHDLEIRGAGELLGENQSGQINAVGFSLYMEMLENAVEAFKKGKDPSLEAFIRPQSEIEMHLPTLLPENFIPDVNIRLSFYKRIANANNHVELNELKIELIDRFGLLPDEVQYLLKTAYFRQKSEKLGIKRIESHEKGGFLTFRDDHQVNPAYLIGLLQKNSTIYRLEGSSKLKFILDLQNKNERLKFIEDLLSSLEDNRLITA